MKKAKNRFLILLKEIGNLLTNVLIPVVGLLIIIAEALPFIPMQVSKALKKVEYVLFNVAGTVDDIEEKVEEKVQKKLK